MVDERKAKATTKAKTSHEGKNKKPSTAGVSLDNADTVIEGGPPATVIGAARIEDAAGAFLTLSDGDFTLALDLDGATFEYQEPREIQVAVMGLSPEVCVCCVSITIDGDKRLIKEPFGISRLMLCELAT